MLMRLRSKASACYKRGEFNDAIIELDKNGIYYVLIYKQGWKRHYRFSARNLNEGDEEILEDELIMEV